MNEYIKNIIDKIESIRITNKVGINDKSLDYNLYMMQLEFLKLIDKDLLNNIKKEVSIIYYEDCCINTDRVIDTFLNILNSKLKELNK